MYIINKFLHLLYIKAYHHVHVPLQANTLNLPYTTPSLLLLIKHNHHHPTILTLTQHQL